MTSAPPPRSYLFVPGTRPDRFDKAIASGADQVILDLEDAVADDRKAEARDAVAAWLKPGTPVAVRINGPTTPWFDDDLALCRQAGVAAVSVPKVDGVDQIRAADAALDGATMILPFIETAAGFHAAESVARAPRVARLLFGSIDFQLDVGIPGEDEALLLFRSQLVLVSRLAGLAAPVDGVTTVFDTLEPVEADARRAQRMGFGGKLCIHPRQVAVVNACFRPTDDEIAWARRVIASEGASGNAVALSGEMVDRPVVARARAILARA